MISIIEAKDDFSKRLRNFPALKCVRENRIHTVSPDSISYYTPADYLKSVGIVSGILTR